MPPDEVEVVYLFKRGLEHLPANEITRSSSLTQMEGASQTMRSGSAMRAYSGPAFSGTRAASSDG